MGQTTVPIIANGTTITTAMGTATSITAPSIGDEYFVYVSDAAGNISAASRASISTDSTAPVVTIASASIATGVIRGESDENGATVEVFSDEALTTKIPGLGSVVSDVLTWTASSNTLSEAIYYVVVTDTVGNETIKTILAS
ncbi:hypothetical protein [Sporosarcina sp. FSL K6-5500]|uniref:hypothetical protein n=1 Tax=Sporosarcina sp. FSL K6-5500 TaxID=2921558 RepID=UPI0030FD110B